MFELLIFLPLFTLLVIRQMVSAPLLTRIPRVQYFTAQSLSDSNPWAKK